MVCRLERHHRQTHPKRVYNKEGGATISGQDAPRNQGRKKIPSLPTVGAEAEAWAKGQRQHHAQVAARAYAKEAGNCQINRLNPSIGNAVIETWRKDNYAPDTISTRRKNLAKFLRHLESIGAPAAISRDLTRVKHPRARTTIATPEEIARLRANASTWMRCWIAIAEGHGPRRSEALRLCPAQHNETQNTITFRTKGEGTNTLPVSDELRAYFEMVKPVADPNTPLVDLIAGRHITRDILYAEWQKLKTKAKVNPQLRPHDLRRTLAQRVYHETKDLLTVQQLLGHENLMSTLIYLQSADPQNLTPLINRLSAANRWKWKN